MEWGSSGLIKHCHRLLVWKLNEYFMENSREYYTLKYYRKQTLNEKLKLMEGSMKFVTKKLLGHEIFISIILWATIFFEKYVKLSAL